MNEWKHSISLCVPPGVIAYSIGIAWAAQDELEYIATDPDKEHSFFVDEFDNLYKFVPKIIQNICQEFNSQPRNWAAAPAARTVHTQKLEEWRSAVGRPGYWLYIDSLCSTRVGAELAAALVFEQWMVFSLGEDWGMELIVAVRDKHLISTYFTLHGQLYPFTRLFSIKWLSSLHSVEKRSDQLLSGEYCYCWF